MKGRLLGSILPDPARSRTILRIAWPVMAAMLTQTFINQLDTILVGLLPQEHSIAGQAALGYSVLLHWLIGGFVGAISVGTQAMTARRMGENDPLGAGKVAFNSLVLGLAAGALVTLLAVIFTRPLFRLFTDNEAVLAEGVPYARARFAGILAMVATLSVKSFFDGLGKTHYHLITAIAMNLVNAGLAVVLVFGLLGAPRMNVLGAGVAALAASYFGLAMMLGFVLRGRYRKGHAIFHWRNLDRKVLWGIARLSLPSGIATAVLMLGILITYHWVGLLDRQAAEVSSDLARMRLEWIQALAPLQASTEAWRSLTAGHAPVNAAATKVIFDLLFLNIMACMGLGIATATLVSQNLGRRQPDEARRYAWTSVRMAALFAGTVGLLMALFPDQAMGIFSHDSEVLDAGRTPMRVVGAFSFAMGFGLVLAQALFGAGAHRVVMWVEITLHFLCLVPLSWLLALPLGMGLTGIFVAAVIYIVGLAAAMTWKFLSGSWQHIRI
jgi:Na+-driven multidrug efflux pump